MYRRAGSQSYLMIADSGNSRLLTVCLQCNGGHFGTVVASTPFAFGMYNNPSALAYSAANTQLWVGAPSRCVTFLLSAQPKTRTLQPELDVHQFRHSPLASTSVLWRPQCIAASWPLLMHVLMSHM